MNESGGGRLLTLFSTESKSLYDMIEMMREVFLETMSRMNLSSLLKDSDFHLTHDLTSSALPGAWVTAFQSNKCTNEELVGRHCSKPGGGGLKGLETERKAETEQPSGRRFNRTC